MQKAPPRHFKYYSKEKQQVKGCDYMKQIKKRDGVLVKYDLEKISTAIASAYEDVGSTFDDSLILDAIERRIELHPSNPISVEEIQDIVEDILISVGNPKAAKAYIKYRFEHEELRRKRRDNAFAEKLFAKNVENQNANVDEHSFGGKIGEASGVILRDYALNNCMSKKSRENHLNMEIYIHDLDHYAVGDHNCLSIPFDDLLAKGFNTRQTDIRPANSVNTAFQLIAVIFQLQSLQQFGGVAATHLDWTMVPYVRKSFYKHFKDGVLWCESPEANGGYSFWIKNLMDKEYNGSLPIASDLYDVYPNAKKYAENMTIKEINHAVEGMFHNLNY